MMKQNGNISDHDERGLLPYAKNRRANEQG